MSEHNVPSVLHLIDSGGFYGAERVIFDLLMELKHSSFPGILGCIVEPNSPVPELARRAQQSNLPVRLFPARRGISWRIIRDIRSFIDERAIQVVHCHGYKPNIICGLMPKRKCHFISTAHGWAQGSGPKIWVYKLLDCLALRAMDSVVGVSDAVVSQLQLAGVKQMNVIKILNGIRMSQHDSSSYNDSMRTKYKIPTGATVVGSVGRLAAVKGYSYLLRAFRQVVTQNANCRLVIAGEGPLRSKLELETKCLGIDSFVSFAGFVSEVDEFFAMIDIFVMPSLSEGLPVALLEAMAHGKPCIASRVGGIPEVVTSSEVGCLIPPSDAAAVGEAISRYATDSELRIRVGESSRRTVSQRFSLQRMAADYCRLYENLHNVIHEN